MVMDLKKQNKDFGKVNTSYSTGNIAKLKNGEFVKIIRKGDISKDRKNRDRRYNTFNTKNE